MDFALSSLVGPQRPHWGVIAASAFGGTMKKFLFATLAASLLASVGNAALITRDYSFTATFNYNAPFTMLTGNFSLTFDNAASIVGGTTSGVMINQTSAYTGGTSQFYYNKTGDQLQIGNHFFIGGNGCYVDFNTSYCLTLSNVSSTNPTASFYYIQNTGAFSGNQFTSQSMALTPFAAASNAPEPASWAMMVGGFALIGSAMRRRKKFTVSFAKASVT
jgi:Na+-transporting NADH:ubiquinone oxidoreductase subunit NqrB